MGDFTSILILTVATRIQCGEKSHTFITKKFCSLISATVILAVFVTTYFRLG